MWARPVALRPVPPYAVVDQAVLDALEDELSRAGDKADTLLDGFFDRFETAQPELADYVSEILDGPLDETATALGSFLSLLIFMGFDRAFGVRLGRVSSDAVRATVDALRLEEELRARSPREPLDLEDVIAQEQPGVMAFVNVHLEAALDEAGAGTDVDVDDVHLVYQAMLVLTLALSHAVAPDERSRSGSRELMA